MTSTLFTESFLRQLISVGIRPNMPYTERKTYFILNTGALIVSIGGAIYCVFNFFQDQLDLLPFSLCFLLIGMVGRLLLLHGKLSAALVILLGSALNDFLMSYLFHNGVEDAILVVVVASFFVVEWPFWRYLIVGICCLGYLFLRAHQFHFYMDRKVPTGRYLANVVIALGLLCFVLETFRNITNRHQRTIEEKNRVVEQQRLLLDIERLTLLEKTEELEEANSSKADLFSVVSHDLRGPIQNLKESLMFLQEGLISQQEFMEIQGRLKKDVDNLHESLETLLEWVSGHMQPVKPQFETIPLRCTADKSASLFMATAAAKEITLLNLIPVEARTVADEGQIQAIFRNLLGNALKFTPRKGQIILQAERNGNDWQMAVTDNGTGMEPERARQIFTTGNYRSTRGTENESGLGLGLQICRRFVREHGGTLWVESAPGEGTTFYFNLPAGEPEASELPAHPRHVSSS